jgi:hypothetical protein
VTKGQRIGFGLAALGAVLVICIPACQPLKFHYAIWRIESATTSAQERDAFILATRVGRVWEINQIHTNEFQGLPSRVKHRADEEVTEIEWLEWPWWGGQPFRAYRVLLDPKNRAFLEAKPK